MQVYWSQSLVFVCFIYEYITSFIHRIIQARLGGSEGRVHALEAQLIQVETAKREVEGKLSSVGSTLRRIAGIQMDGSISLPYKLSSPTRRWV